LGALIALLLLSPILILSSLVIAIFLDKEFVFSQNRVGKFCKIFRIYKFKTMKEIYQNGLLLPDEKRLTKLGRFLRKYSIDELPQLINIILGDMSFVGPRPLLPEYLPFYTNLERRRHEVMPGITGLAQINGRNSISWDEKLNFDVIYVIKTGFVFDLKIIFHSIIKVVKGADISAKDHATMPMLSKVREVNK
jgi:lipopolysaccharide/colanic/teichoic acid biosynthesis glycosyltransferase